MPLLGQSSMATNRIGVVNSTSRKRILSILVLMTVTLSCSMSISITKVNGYEQVSTVVQMKERTLRVTVQYLDADADWAHHVLDIASIALPRIEDLAGFPYPYGFDITIHVQKTTYGGENRGEKGIWLDPGTWDFAVVHELSHYWTDIYSKRWLQEAFATLYPILIFQEWGDSNDILWVRDTHLDWFHQYFSKYEQPLDVWKGEDVMEIHDFLYGKMYCTIYMLFRELGIGIFQKTNLSIHSDSIANSLRFKSALEHVSGSNLTDLFSGWVFGNSYVKYGPGDFALDNGLLILDKRISGLDTAEVAIEKAQQEGRTQGLLEAREQLADASPLLILGQYDQVASLVRHVIELAAKASVPATTTTTSSVSQSPISIAPKPTAPRELPLGWIYIVVATLALVIATTAIARRLVVPTKKPTPVDST